VQIRVGERALDLEHSDPEDAIRALVAFTLEHFVSKPWFISMLNTENLRGGATRGAIEDVSEIQSPLVSRLREVLDRGVAMGRFRPGIDPVDLYITIASLCYFPVSNRHTLRVVFGVPIDDAWLARKAEEAADMLIDYLSAPRRPGDALPQNKKEPR
jgi:hypothetical protein